MCIQCFHSASLQDIYKKTKTFTSIKYKEYIETLGSERVLCKKRGSLQKGYSFLNLFCPNEDLINSIEGDISTTV